MTGIKNGWMYKLLNVKLNDSSILSERKEITELSKP